MLCIIVINSNSMDSTHTFSLFLLSSWNFAANLINKPQRSKSFFKNCF